MYLFFDTETTGLPKNYRAPLDDFLNWPRIVQLSWSLYDLEGHHWESQNYIIRPDGFIIPAEASAIHRITQERAEQEGVPLVQALKHFLEHTSNVDYLVAHNIDFDEKIIGSELLRLGLPALPDTPRICTMRSTAQVCQIPSPRGGYKWPNLTELYRHLFNSDFPEAHDAVFDVKACADCFFELKRRRAI